MKSQEKFVSNARVRNIAAALAATAVEPKEFHFRGACWLYHGGRVAVPSDISLRTLTDIGCRVSDVDEVHGSYWLPAGPVVAAWVREQQDLQAAQVAGRCYDQLGIVPEDIYDVRC